jgi:hypothetical protein
MHPFVRRDLLPLGQLDHTNGRGVTAPGTMTILESAVTTTEHRCEALTISDIPPYRCTTSATADRQGRAVCPAHSRVLRIRWFDGDAPHG